jgi:hypothetical protein
MSHSPSTANQLTISQSTVFDSLAHETTHQTVVSLISASSQISTRVSPTDAHLFLISHLLAFKHHLLAFDIESASADVSVDFAAPLWAISASIFSPAKLMRAVSQGFVPKIVTEALDARGEVDSKLRDAIGEVVNAWTERMTAPIQGVSNGKATQGRVTTEKEGPKTDASRAAQVRETIEREVPLVRRKMDEYIHDRRTRDMLLRAVLEEVMVKYAGWMEKQGLTSPIGPGRRAKGKGREDGVWEEDSFGEWAVGAFGLDDVLDEEDEDRGFD